MEWGRSMHLDIYSDTVCPWCLIGKRRLERALALRPEPGLTVRWQPFQLNPGMPVEGMARAEYVAMKFGDRGGDTYARVRGAGAEDGIAFAFERIARQPNTLDSHRLIDLAWQAGCQDAVVEALFLAFFLEGRDIGDRAVLTAVAKAAGMDGAVVARYLDSEDGDELIGQKDAAARGAGINGVPFFVLEGTHALSGAQPPEIFYRLFDHGRQKAADPAVVS